MQRLGSKWVSGWGVRGRWGLIMQGLGYIMKDLSKEAMGADTTRAAPVSVLGRQQGFGRGSPPRLMCSSLGPSCDVLRGVRAFERWWKVTRSLGRSPCKDYHRAHGTLVSSGEREL